MKRRPSAEQAAASKAVGLGILEISRGPTKSRSIFFPRMPPFQLISPAIFSSFSCPSFQTTFSSSTLQFEYLYNQNGTSLFMSMFILSDSISRASSSFYPKLLQLHITVLLFIQEAIMNKKNKKDILTDQLVSPQHQEPRPPPRPRPGPAPQARG